jgi:hypothetical protein
MTPLPDDTGKAVERLRSDYTQDISDNGGRILSHIAMRKDLRALQASREEQGCRISAIEKTLHLRDIDMAVSNTRHDEALGSLLASMREIKTAISEVRSKVDFLDGETTGLHSANKETQGRRPALQITVGTWAGIGAAATGAGALVSWVLSHL